MMRAIYHPEYKTAQELDDAIARLEKIIDSASPWFGVVGLKQEREELLYDLTNRRDDGKLRWISPKYYTDHVLWWWTIKDLEERVKRMRAELKD